MKPFENIVGKGENAGNHHFLLFPCFLHFPKQISIFQSFFLLSANGFKLDQFKTLSFGKELTFNLIFATMDLFCRVQSDLALHPSMPFH